MDPGLQTGLAKLVPDCLLRGAANPDPERQAGLQGVQEGQPACLGRRVAGRHGKLVAEPGGKEQPGVGRNRPASHPPLESLRPGGPAWSIADRHQTIEGPPGLAGPGSADPVDFVGIEQGGKQELILHLKQVKGLDPAPPAAERGHRAQYKVAIAPPHVGVGPQRLGHRGLEPCDRIEDSPQHGGRDRRRQVRHGRKRLHLGRTGTWGTGLPGAGAGAGGLAARLRGAAAGPVRRCGAGLAAEHPLARARRVSLTRRFSPEQQQGVESLYEPSGANLESGGRRGPRAGRRLGVVQWGRRRAVLRCGRYPLPGPRSRAVARGVFVPGLAIVCTY